MRGDGGLGWERKRERVRDGEDGETHSGLYISVGFKENTKRREECESERGRKMMVRDGRHRRHDRGTNR